MLLDVLSAEIEDIGRLLADRFDGRYLSILLLGSAARGEITVDAQGGVLSDLDFLLVLPQTLMPMALLETRLCQSRLQALSTRFTRSSFRHISVGFAHSVPRYWAVATPSMWELRGTGRVLHGSTAVKEWPALQRTEDIPRWEGIRLIANRTCEILEVLGAANANLSSSYDALLLYACVKAALACSEATLIDSGLYAATYGERWQRHADVAACFTDNENGLIDIGYRLKLGQSACLRPPAEPTVREALRLVLSTLTRLGITTPSDFVRRVESGSNTAPGFEQDALYCMAQAMRFRRVPVRRAITAVYADAYRATLSIVQHGSDHTFPGTLCQQVASRYRACPQTVSMVPGWTRARRPGARMPC